MDADHKQEMRIAEYLRAQPYTEPTRKLARMLTLLAFALLVSHWLKITFEGIPLLGVNFTSESESDAQFLLALATGFFMVRYLLCFLTDAFVEMDRNAKIKGFFAARELEELKEQAQAVDEDAYSDPEDERQAELRDESIDPWWYDYLSKKEELREIIQRLRPVDGEKKMVMQCDNKPVGGRGQINFSSLPD